MLAAIAVPLPKIKEMVRSLKVEHVTEEVSRALERMNKEIVSTSPGGPLGAAWWKSHRKTPEERRENHLVQGTVSLFSGIGLMIFLHYVAAALVLKLPPDVMAQIPFELAPLVRVIWLAGLVPALSGVGHIVAALLIRPARPVNTESSGSGNTDATSYGSPTITGNSVPERAPASVTEHTTNLLGPP